ncbi:MAG: ABC transporter ATP-binding protein [Leptospirillum sp.]|nr:ATP-binding cassette domain-containing protein [Nitrospiraceae bacterium]
MIEFENVSLGYGDKVIVREITLEIPDGKTLVILGGSGSGKSTLLKGVLGLLHCFSGRIVVNGAVVDSLTQNELLSYRQRIGMVFQEGALFDSMTVGENVGFWLWEHTDMTDSEIEARVRLLLSFVGLIDAINLYPGELSGGMKRRVAIARAMAPQDPLVMLYDEPTTGLDPFTSKSICDLIRQVQKEFGVSSLVVTHDLQDAFRVGDLFTFVKDGTLVVTGDRDAISKSTDPFVRTFLAI